MFVLSTWRPSAHICCTSILALTVPNHNTLTTHPFPVPQEPWAGLSQGPLGVRMGCARLRTALARLLAEAAARELPRLQVRFGSGGR